MNIQKKRLQLNWLLWVLISLVFACSSEQNLRDVVDDQSLPEHPSFNFDIRPILSNNCYLCHGPDISTREANLRLDLEEGLTAELGDGRQVIVPGNPGQSELMWRVRNHNPDLVMPPPETKRMLSDREIALLDRWIEQGAKWEPYWAFKKPAKPDIPSGYDHAIDALVTEKLEDLGLEPAPIADANALVRRLSYVLTGLPPSAHQLGHGPLDGGASYEELVDKFMASPHFGERWARHWMDLTRYAEGKGHEFDYPVLGAWQYRDYLIRAFNADLPYDQIVKEHLAGDLIEPPRLHPTEGFNESLIATMHYRMSEGKHSPVDIKEEESDRIDNIIDVTTKTFQALTVSCAQCHDHKFDPIPTADYYSLYGIFESTRQAVHQRESLEQVNQTRQAIDDQIAYLKSAVSTELRSLSSMPQAQQISHSPSPESPEAKALGHFANGETNGWTTQGLVRNILGEVVEQDGHLQLAAGALSNEHHEGNFAAVRSPTFLLDKDSIVVRARGKQATVRLIIDNFQLIQNPIYGELELHLDNEEYADLLFPVGPWIGHKAYLEVHTGQYDRHHLHITEKSSFALQWAQDFDQERPKLPSVEEATAHPAEALDRWENGKATGGDIVLLNQLLEKQPISHKVREIARESGASGQVVDSLLFQGVVEGDAVFSPIFLRGSHMSLADTAESHRFLSAVGSADMSFPQVGSGRLAFAEALVHPENPLTARVMVNRIWHHLFGRGLVETVDNFGLQGKAPTHPALLDHLAIRFMESGWSIKDLIRYILLSETFQRSTKASADPNDVDPLNLYLRHYPIRRLEAESIRDGILATSGSLELTMFGPSIPIHLDEFLRGRGRPPASGPLDGKGRRSIYQAIPRNFLPPMMLTFDMPAPFSTFGRRNISNVPAQSLTLMNSPFVLQESERWAAGLLSREASFDDRVSIVYHTAFGREANSAERNEAKQFFSNQADVYGEKGLSAIDDGRIWRDYLHTIFMMKEFIFLI